MNRDEPLLREEKDELVFGKEETVKKEAKPEVVDAADEIIKNFTKEIPIPEIPKDENPFSVEDKQVSFDKIPFEDKKDEVDEKKDISLVIEETPKQEESPFVFPTIDASDKKEVEEASVEKQEDTSIKEKKDEVAKEDTTTVVKDEEKTAEEVKEDTSSEKVEISKQEEVSGEKQEDAPKKKGKSVLIVTLVISFIVLYLLGKTLYGFYLGFKYKDYDPNQENQNTTETNQVNE